MHGGEEMMGYLLGLEGGRGIIDVGDDHGSTPLHYALQSPTRGVVELLKLHGATTPLCEDPSEENGESYCHTGEGANAQTKSNLEQK